MSKNYTKAYRGVTLSILVGGTSYSYPRREDLPVADYECVEVALIDASGRLRHPSFFGLAGFDKVFETGECPVAGYVSQHELAILRVALKGL